MTKPTYNVLFLCTGNSARSVLAESLVNRLGAGHFAGFSAGSHPKGQVHPLALQLLRQLGYPTEQLRSKSWDEFAAPGSPKMDFVFTVCDNAAGEVCPVWPGHPATAHWGVDDPAAVAGSDEEQYRAFAKAYRELEARIKSFTSLPVRSLGELELRERLRAIGTARYDT